MTVKPLIGNIHKKIINCYKLYNFPMHSSKLNNMSACVPLSPTSVTENERRKYGLHYTLNILFPGFLLNCWNKMSYYLKCIIESKTHPVSMWSTHCASLLSFTEACLRYSRFVVILVLKLEKSQMEFEYPLINVVQTWCISVLYFIKSDYYEERWGNLKHYLIVIGNSTMS